MGMAMDQDAARRNFRDLLKLNGWTTKDVAEASGVSVGTLYNWLKDTNPPNLGTAALSKVAQTLGVNLDQMFYTGPHEIAESPEEATRQRILRQIDGILANIDDPQEQDRAGALILATLRAYQDGYERQRAAQPGPRRAGVGPTPGPSARHPGAP